MGKVRLLTSLVKQMGLPWVSYRVWYEARKRMGLLEKRFPAQEFTDELFLNKVGVNSKGEMLQLWEKEQGQFFPVFADLTGMGQYLRQTLSKEEQRQVIHVADQGLQGKILCFSRWYGDYGQPINWQLNPVTKQQGEVTCHWSRVNDLSKKFGDIKYLWEASRFPHFYYFVRAYHITGDEKYAQAFWEQFESWVQENPVEMGRNWKCGQELTLRVFAWLFGLYGFKDAQATTPERIFQLIKTIYYHANHIDKHFEFTLYAVKNNHTISESCGLFTIGLLFPFMDKNQRWLKKGKKYLEQEGIRQIYADGSYLQHSMNYQRLVVQVFTWALALARQNNQDFSAKLKERLLKSVNFLYQAQGDGKRVPNYGSNDGALIFPLSVAGYLDYCPQLNALHVALTGERLYAAGFHEEEMVWFNGHTSLSKPIKEVKRTSTAYPIGGYYLLRSRESFAFTRCCVYKDRPAQADMLHLDLWWKGLNILSDSGSYSYNPEAEVGNYFISSRAHNTIIINEKDQMQKGSRFLWMDWTKAKCLTFKETEDGGEFQGEHYGYQPVTHRRSILRDGEVWLVVDQLLNVSDEITVQQNWHLGQPLIEEQEGQFILDTPEGNYSILCVVDQNTADTLQVETSWESLYYGEKVDRNCITRKVKVATDARLITVCAPTQMVTGVELKGNLVTIRKNDGQQWVTDLSNM